MNQRIIRTSLVLVAIALRLTVAGAANADDRIVRANGGKRSTSADADRETPDGTTPLHLAVLANDLKRVRQLIRNGADANPP